MDLANLELRNDISTAELQWLYDNPILWLRALQRMKNSTENSISKARLALAPLKPAAGINPSEEYLRAKIEHDIKLQRKLHFLKFVIEKLDNVATIIGPRPAFERMLLSDVLKALDLIREMIKEDDVENALDYIDRLTRSWTRK